MTRESHDSGLKTDTQTDEVTYWAPCRIQPKNIGGMKRGLKILVVLFKALLRDSPELGGVKAASEDRSSVVPRLNFLSYIAILFKYKFDIQ